MRTPGGDDRARVAAYLDGRPGSSALRALLVARDGRLVVEEYRGSTAEQSRVVASVTKSVTATLVGLAIADGHLAGVDQTVGELLPDRVGQMARGVADLTVAQLLTMTSGYPRSSHPAVEPGDDWTAEALGAVLFPPGFRYAGDNWVVLSQILVDATGRSLLAYASEELLGPIGVDTEPAREPTFDPAALPEPAADGFGWVLGAGGVHMGEGGLLLRPADLLALGQLFLEGGRRGSEQVVPRAWVDEATRDQAGIPDDEGYGYGYGWWVRTLDGDPAYLAWGVGGQVIAVVPERGLVVVMASEVGPEDLGEDDWVTPEDVDAVVGLLGG